MSDAEQIAGQAFGAWSNAPCGDAGTPSIQTQLFPAVNCDGANGSQGHSNLIIFRDDDWTHDDAANVIGYTTLTVDLTTGEMFGAEIEINTHDYTVVANLADAGPPRQGTELVLDLGTILTHEAGHFLGLAHSPDTSAVMYAHYQAGTTTLTPDDVSGICAMYQPGDIHSTSDGLVSAPTCMPTPPAGLSAHGVRIESIRERCPRWARAPSATRAPIRPRAPRRAARSAAGLQAPRGSSSPCSARWRSARWRDVEGKRHRARWRGAEGERRGARGGRSCLVGSQSWAHRRWSRATRRRACRSRRSSRSSCKARPPRPWSPRSRSRGLGGGPHRDVHPGERRSGHGRRAARRSLGPHPRRRGRKHRPDRGRGSPVRRGPAVPRLRSAARRAWKRRRGPAPSWWSSALREQFTVAGGAGDARRLAQASDLGSLVAPPPSHWARAAQRLPAGVAPRFAHEVLDGRPLRDAAHENRDRVGTDAFMSRTIAIARHTIRRPGGGVRRLHLAFARMPVAITFAARRRRHRMRKWGRHELSASRRR